MTIVVGQRKLRDQLHLREREDAHRVRRTLRSVQAATRYSSCGQAEEASAISSWLRLMMEKNVEVFSTEKPFSRANRSAFMYNSSNTSFRRPPSDTESSCARICLPCSSVAAPSSSSPRAGRVQKELSRLHRPGTNRAAAAEQQGDCRSATAKVCLSR